MRKYTYYISTWLFFSTSFTFSHPRRKILHLEVQDPLYYPLQTVVRRRSILLSHITLCCPTVFLCFSQQYLSKCFNSIFRLLPDLRAPSRSRRAVYWPCPALPRMLLLWPPAPTSQKCKVVAANKLFQYLQWHEYIQHLYLSKQKDCLTKSIKMHKSPITKN